jgi:hypothetical protein
MSTMSTAPRIEFCTVADSRYFVGLVGLLNSLRLTGNDGALTVLDVGLTEEQRSRLAPHVKTASLADLGAGTRTPHAAKPASAMQSTAEVVVVIDTDVLVTSRLDAIVNPALGGKIVVFPDGPHNPRRCFAEWSEIFDLAVPLRPDQVYVGSGMVALSPKKWPSFLARWAAACESIPPESSKQRREYHDVYRTWPYADPDQDALNALLMSEMPQSAIQVLPYRVAPFPQDMSRVRIEDKGRLACTLQGTPTLLLHYSMAPKPWQPLGWTRAGRQAFLELFPRVVLGDDAPLRLERHELPRWLANRALQRSLAVTAPAARAGAHAMARLLPVSARGWLRSLTRRA